MRIPTTLMFHFTVIRDELKIDLGFSAKGYGDILLRRIEVFIQELYMQVQGNVFFLINLLKVNVQQKI